MTCELFHTCLNIRLTHRPAHTMIETRADEYGRMESEGRKDMKGHIIPLELIEIGPRNSCTHEYASFNMDITCAQNVS